MATAYSQPLQYTPYQEQWNKELLAKALQYKQDKYDTNRQVIKETIAQVSNIDLIKDQDAEYLYDRLQTVVNNLNTQGTGDLSLDSRADYLTGYVADVADQKVMNGYIGTRAYRNVVAEHEKYKETGEASDLNLSYSLQDISAWANDGQIGSALPAGANTSYVKFTDLYEKYQEVAKALQPDSYVVFEQFGGSGFTWYSQEGLRLDKNKLVSAFNLATESDPAIQDQLRVNAWGANLNVSDADFIATFKEDGAREKEAIGRYINRLKDAKAKSVSSSEMAELDANIAIYEEQVKQYDEALMMTDEQILANKESYQYLSYRSSYFTDLAGVFSYEQMEAPKLVTDQGALEMYKQQQANARNRARIQSKEDIARAKAIVEEDKMRIEDEKALKALAIEILKEEDTDIQEGMLRFNQDLIARNPEYAAKLNLVTNFEKKEPRLTLEEAASEYNVDLVAVSEGDYSTIASAMGEGAVLPEFESPQEAAAFLVSQANIAKGFDNTNSYDPMLDAYLANGMISQKQYNEMTAGGYSNLTPDEFQQLFNPIETTAGVQNLQFDDMTVTTDDGGQEELNTLNIQTKINEFYGKNDVIEEQARKELVTIYGEEKGNRLYRELAGLDNMYYLRIIGKDTDGSNIIQKEYATYDKDGKIDIKSTEADWDRNNYLWNENANEPMYYKDLGTNDIRAMVNPAALTGYRQDIPEEQVFAAADRLSTLMTQYSVNEQTINHLVNARDGVRTDFRSIADEAADNIIDNKLSFLIHNDKGGSWNAMYNEDEDLWFIEGTWDAKNMRPLSIGEEGVRRNLRNKLGPGKMPGKEYSWWNFTKWGTSEAGTADYIETYDIGTWGATNKNRISLEANNDQAERIVLDNALLLTAPKESFSLARNNEQQYLSSIIAANQSNFEPITASDIAMLGEGQNLQLKTGVKDEGDKTVVPAALGRFTALTDGAVIDQTIKNNVGATEDNAATTTAMDGNASIITTGGYHYIIAGYDTRNKDEVSVIGGKIPVGAIDYSQPNPFHGTLQNQITAAKTAENNYYMERVVANRLEWDAETQTGERYIEPLDRAQQYFSPNFSVDGVSYTAELNQSIERVGPNDVDYGLVVKVNKFTTDENGNKEPHIFQGGEGNENNIDFIWTPLDANGNPLTFDTPSDFQLYIQENYNDETAPLAFASAINASNEVPTTINKP
jgi:hypothetical protein